MILILGGTTEAKQVAGYLEEQGLEYIYSTRIKTVFEGRGMYRYGPLDKDGLLDYCRNSGVGLIINASHPFAIELHAALEYLEMEIPVIRYERKFSERSTHPLVTYIKDHSEGLELLRQQGHTSMLVLSGVKSIPLLKPYWEKFTCWFRILNRESSFELAVFHRFMAENLIFGLPQDLDKEIIFFSTLQPSVILTKESGLNGKLDAKIGAAIACKIPIFILKKPLVAESFIKASNREELLNLLVHV